MARIDVYLPDDLADEARKAGVNISAITQDGVRRVLAARSTDAWLAGLDTVPARRVGHDLALEALDSSREDAPTRHRADVVVDASALGPSQRAGTVEASA